MLSESLRSPVSMQVADTHLFSQRQDIQTLSQSQMMLQKPTTSTESPSYSAAPSPYSSVGSVDVACITNMLKQRKALSGSQQLHQSA